MLLKQKLVFSKKCKNVLFDTVFRKWPFSSDFNFACKDGRVTAATWTLLQTLSVPILAKSSIWNVAEFLDLSLQTWPCTKTSSVLCGNQSFFLLFRNVATFIESHCVFHCYFFTIWWSVFDQPFRRLLPLSCLYGYSQWFKVKITCERVHFIKKQNQIRLLCL